MTIHYWCKSMNILKRFEVQIQTVQWGYTYTLHFKALWRKQIDCDVTMT